jgi:hypothetical protein
MIKRFASVLVSVVLAAVTLSAQGAWVTQNGNQVFIARSVNSAFAITIQQQNTSACTFKLVSGTATTALTVCGTVVTLGGSIAFPSAGSTPSVTAHALYSPDGAVLYFNGSAVGGGAAAAGSLTGTTLASNVVTSSLTTVGTIASGIWNAGAVTSSGAVTDSVGSMASLRSGAWALASQATGDLACASSGSQWARLASAATGKILQANTGACPSYSTATYPSTAGTSGKILISDGTNIVSSTPTYPSAAGTSGNLLTSDGTNWLSSAAPAASKSTVLKAGRGTSVATTATNLDTIAISGLTALDRLVVEVTADSVTQDTSALYVYNSTDSLIIDTTSTITAGTGRHTLDFLSTAENNTKKIQYRFPANFQGVAVASIAFTTDWTGSWTLALRHNGITSGGTLNWNWIVYKLAGQ